MTHTSSYQVAANLLGNIGVKAPQLAPFAEKYTCQIRKGVYVGLDNSGHSARVFFKMRGHQHTIVCHGDGTFDLEGALCAKQSGVITGSANDICGGMEDIMPFCRNLIMKALLGSNQQLSIAA